MRKWKESTLCKLFMEKAREDGWVVYPEQGIWDILMVDPSTNEQVGVQAKGSLNWKVLYQAINHYNDMDGSPHRRAVLIPHADKEFMYLCNSLKLGVYDLTNILEGDDLWEETNQYKRTTIQEPNFKWDIYKPCWLPDIVPDLPAGVPSPRKLTQWRQKALKLCSILRQQGYVTNLDFKKLKLSNTIWIYNDWIRPSYDRIIINNGRYMKYVLGQNSKLPDIGWEKERDLLANF